MARVDQVEAAEWNLLVAKIKLSSAHEYKLKRLLIEKKWAEQDLELAEQKVLEEMPGDREDKDGN